MACPYQAQDIQFNGDSIGVELPSRLNLPGYRVFNAAQGGGAFVKSDFVPTIGARIK